MPKKLDDSSFIYMQPRRGTYGPHDQFAQCSTCMMWVKNRQQCMIHGPGVRTTWDTTCTLYVNGKPHDDGKTHAFVTPKESGAERRQVRCENCFYFKKRGSICMLFYSLNRLLPKYFKLSDKVHRFGCCNANVPNKK